MDVFDRLTWLAPLVRSSGEESALVEALSERIGTLRLPSTPRRHGDSLVVPVSAGSGTGPHLVVNAQLDTQPSDSPRTPRIDGSKSFGPGASGPLANLALALDLLEEPPVTQAQVTLVLHARKELGFDISELALVLDEDPVLARVDCALVLEATGNAPALGCGGSTHATLVFEGQSAHSGRAPTGTNAVHRFARVLTELAQWEAKVDVCDGFTWFELLTATSAHGGAPGTVVPSFLQVSIHHAFGPSVSSHDSQDRLIALVDRVGIVRFEDLSPPSTPKRDSPLIRDFLAPAPRPAIAQQTWNEVSRFSERGIPAFSFGPGDPALLHIRQEALDRNEFDLARSTLRSWLERAGG